MGDFRIYLLTDPRNPSKGYVGQTRFSSRRRYRQHVRMAARGEVRLPVHRWLRNLLRLGLVPGFRILQTCSDQTEVDAAECEWIRVCRLLYGMKLYNVTDGGGGTSGEAIAAKMRAHCAKPETKKQRSEAMRATWKDPAIRSRRVRARRAANQRLEVRQRRSDISKKIARESWDDPAKRARRVAGLRSKERHEKMRAKWAEPGYRERVGAAIAAASATPDQRAAMSARAKEVNARPEVKEAIRASSRARWADPEYKARVAKAISVARRRVQPQDQKGGRD